MLLVRQKLRYHGRHRFIGLAKYCAKQNGTDFMLPVRMQVWKLVGGKALRLPALELVQPMEFSGR